MNVEKGSGLFDNNFVGLMSSLRDNEATCPEYTKTHNTRQNAIVHNFSSTTICRQVSRKHDINPLELTPHAKLSIWNVHACHTVVASTKKSGDGERSFFNFVITYTQKDFRSQPFARQTQKSSSTKKGTLLINITDLCPFATCLSQTALKAPILTDPFQVFDLRCTKYDNMGSLPLYVASTRNYFKPVLKHDKYEVPGV